ncbi:hypothetical protein PG994_011825 [Apiospora phragmitis]|uniref:Uncharacterized protein n=1 Tax=Apiospora phragmitis TaxID=2905665 RepID=A0ABR1TTV5_9PEZI
MKGQEEISSPKFISDPRTLCQPQRAGVNGQYAALVDKLQNAGRPIIWKDLSWMKLEDGIGPDGVHPDDHGYAMMARMCLTQKGSGQGDGIYMHSSVEQGIIWEQDSGWDRDQWMFARLWSSAQDDLLGWFRETDDSPITYVVWKNTFGSGPVGDGRDDFCCIYGNRDLYCSINNGDGTNDKWPSFTSHSMIKQNEGWPQANVRLADIDGDGRTDYCVLKDNGSIDCWRNGGTNSRTLTEIANTGDFKVGTTGSGSQMMVGLRLGLTREAVPRGVMATVSISPGARDIIKTNLMKDGLTAAWEDLRAVSIPKSSLAKS